MPMFCASIGFFFSLLGFLPQLDQITQERFGFGLFGDNVDPMQGIAGASLVCNMSGKRRFFSALRSGWRMKMHDKDTVLL